MSVEEGKIYKFINFKTGSAVTLRYIIGGVAGDRFEGNKNQLWEAQATPAGFWRFKNVQFGLYLGTERGQVATEGLNICGVSHPFDWALKPIDEKGISPALFKLFIPFTKQVLDLDSKGGWGNGIKIQSWSDQGNGHAPQKWIVDSETRYEAPVEAGKIYMIINRHTGTVVELEHTAQTAGYGFNGGRTQKWEASQEEGTGYWIFKNPWSRLYMGIADDISAAGNRTRIVGVSRPVAWDVVPDRSNGADGKSYRIFLPYTGLNLDLRKADPGTSIHLWDRTDVLWHLWRFELLDTAFEAPVTAGEMYMIVNCHSGTVVHLEDNKKTAGYSFNDGRNQKWEASQEEETGYWIFKNPWSGLYMGITGDTASAGSGTRIVGVPQPFAWDVVRDRTNSKSYRIFLPYTGLNLDLHKADPGTSIHLGDRADVLWHRWRFELLAQLGSGGPAELSDNDLEVPVTAPGPQE